MNSTQIKGTNGWLGTYAVRIIGKDAFISVVFSWQLEAALKHLEELKAKGYNVNIGGPAAKYAGIGLDDYEDAVTWHNPDACRTSSGCVFNCDFCIVYQTEGELKEKPSWIPRPTVIDNCLNACSRIHFDKVIDSIKPFSDVDINQGVSATLLTEHHADRLRELDLKYIRIAWDNINYESKFMRGWDILRRAGFPRSKIAVYVLIGFRDTPEDALYRLEMVRRLGGVPFAMRYQPLNTPKRNTEVGENWTHKELVRYCRYWNNQRATSRVPFKEFK